MAHECDDVCEAWGCDKPEQTTRYIVHNHVTRDIKRPGVCPACDALHHKTSPAAAGAARRPEITDTQETAP